MLKHITRVRATIRELVDMSKEMTESEVVEWLVIALPDSDKHKALTSALLNEEEKRRERKRGNRHDERHDRPRDAERKRTYEAMGIEDMTLEINALQTRLTELSDKPRKTGDSLL
ncbi:hypothetical protein B5M09_008344 [Aphanomyces astaci]|uniref:Uncharacterized protein n=1 Tax=Aphanomyces astaci TaxID=112090 RepID=A0A3R7Y9F7_APHAT|nr:hypothetical protein B5M09_008344 [Aphanomyces astaci]